MNELTNKELAAYLPYGLYLESDNLNTLKLVGINTLQDVKLLPIYEEIWDGENYLDYGLYYNQKLQFKPMLYPLDFLIRKIRHNGEIFIPIERISEYYGYEITKGEPINMMPYIVVQQLLEWKLDVFNLIDNNLAIAVTKKFNPYR